MTPADLSRIEEEAQCDRCWRIRPKHMMRIAPNKQKVCPICIADGRGDDCKDAPRMAPKPGLEVSSC